MDDQPTGVTTAATADMFDLVEADLLRILRSRARTGDLRPPMPGRPSAPRQARQRVSRPSPGRVPLRREEGTHDPAAGSEPVAGRRR